MDLKRLPFLPIHFFYFQFSKAAQRTFWYGILLLLLAGGCFLYSYLNPYAFSLSTEYVTTYESQPTTLETVHHHYRSFDIEANVVWQQTAFSAGPILPRPAPFYLFAGLQWLAWCLFLGAASLIRTRWVYAFYLVFSLFVFFSGMSEALVPPDDPLIWAVRAGMILSFLLPAYLWQENILKWHIGWRVLTLSAIAAVWFVFVDQHQHWTHLHDSLTTLFYYEIVLLVLYLIFIGKDPVNLLILIGTNHPQRARRWPAWLIYLAFGMWFLMVLLWLYEYLNFGFLGEISLGIRPGHLFLVAALFTVFTSQNQYHQVRYLFSSQVSFTLVILSLSVVMLSFGFVNISTGDHFFGYALERLAAIAFLGMGLAYIIFVLMNHGRLLREKVNLYYIMTQSRDLRFFVVWLIGFGLVAVISASDGYKSKNLFEHNSLVQLGDQAWLNGDLKRADKAYRFAIDEVKGSVKAHYNRGALSLAQNPQVTPAVNAYMQATQAVEFPWARINAANLLTLGRQYETAKQILLQGMNTGQADGPLLNNLALLYSQLDKPDSSILCYQAALLADLDAGPIYANLAHLYRAYDRPEEAQAFFEAGLAASPTEPSVWANYLAWLKVQPEAPASETVAALAPFSEVVQQDVWAAYHYLLAFPAAEMPVARQSIQTMANSNASPDAGLLESYLCLQEGIDSVEVAMSRLTFLAQTNPSFQPQAYQLLGAYYYSWDVWEMARHYFALRGDAYGALQAAKVNIDLGWKNAANNQLSALRVKDVSLWEPCSRELALLLNAYNQPIYAQTEWNYSAFSWDEYMRLGLYADSMNQYITALEAFRRAIEVDSMATAPYLEMGRIFNRYEDPEARTNLTFGLDKSPKDIELHIAMAEAEALAGLSQDAMTRLEGVDTTQLSVSVRSHWVQAYVQAQLGQQDTAALTDWLLTYLSDYPLDLRNRMKLVSLFEAQGQSGAALIQTEHGLLYNPESYTLWLTYAHLSRVEGFAEDAGFGAQKAMDLTPDEPTQAAIAREFAKELAQLK